MKHLGLVLLTLVVTASLLGSGCGGATSTTYQVEYKVMNSRLKPGSLSLLFRYNDSGARR